MHKRLTFEQLLQASILEVGDGYRAKNSELGGDGPIFLRSAYLQEHGFVRDMPERFREADLKRFGSKSAQLGDVVVTTKGNSTGRVGVVRSEQVGAVYSPHLSYWRSKDHSLLDQRFLAFWSQSTEFQSQLAAMAYSTDMAPYLSLRDQRRLHISLPEIGQQHYIAKVLGSLDDKIELNRRMNETLETMAQSIFRDWFVEFGPTRRKIGGATDPVEVMGGLVADPDRARELAELFSANMGDSGLPEGWGYSTIGDEFDIKIGRTPPRKEQHHFTLTPDGVPWMSIRDLGNCGVFIHSSAEGLTHDAVQRFRVPHIEAETVVVSFKLTVGRVAVTDRPMLSNEAIAQLGRKSENQSPWFAYLWMKLFDYSRLGSTSSIATAVNSKSIKSVEFPVVPAALGLAFHQLVDPMFRLIRVKSSETRTLAATRDLLLPKLMSGEIRLDDARHQAEEVA